MKKITLAILLLLSFLSYSQILIDERLSLEIIDTQSSNYYEGCIGTVTFQYEIQTIGVDYLIRRTYLHNNNIYDYLLTGEEVTLGIHQITLNIGWDSSFSLLGGEGSIGPGRNGAFISSVLTIDRCETKAHIINSDFTTNQLQVVIEDSDPNYAYWIFETSENSTLESTGIVFGNNIISNNGAFDLNLTTNPERVIELHEGPTSFSTSFPDWVPRRISQMSSLEVRPNNGIELSFEESTSNSSGQITSGTVTINISENEYESSAYYYLDVPSIYPNINITDIITGSGTYQIPNIAISDIDTTITLRKCTSGRCNTTRSTTIALARIYIDIFPNDFDNDGIPDANDNCPDMANADQADDDNDTIGDVCDNCPNDSNPNQLDNDNDNIGNECDNCPNDFNSSQLDTDNDNIGNVCDGDDDNDGRLDGNDNCPLNYNPNQDDDDGDGIGDECDNCPQNSNPNQEDSNNDGIGDACQTNPDLTTNTSYISINSECSACHPILSELGSNRHIISRFGGILTLDFLVNNITSAQAGQSSIKYYFSTNTTIDSSDWLLTTGGSNSAIETFVPSINGNSSTQINQTIFGSDLIDIPYGNFNLIVKLDAENSVTEASESNNTFIVKIRYREDINSGRSAFLDLGNNNLIEIELPTLLQAENNSRAINSHNLKIYNFGNLTMTPLINQRISEGQTINVSHLPGGFYVVHINDSYLLKFGKIARAR